MKNTLAEVGRIMGGERGFPSTVEISQKINSLVSSPTPVNCNFSDRVEDLLEAEAVYENDEEIRCIVAQGESYQSIEHEGVTYKIPSVTSIEDYLANCTDKDLLLDNASNKNAKSNKDNFLEYSNSNSVKLMIEELRLNSKKCLTSKNRHVCLRNPPKDRKSTDKPTGYCLKYVKNGVVAGGFTSGEYPLGQAARNSGAQWKKYGFKNLLDDPKYKDMTPYDAPKGAILVYSGGNWGHVEVKASENEYISDYVGEKPIYDELNIPRKIIGIYIQ